MPPLRIGDTLSPSMTVLQIELTTKFHEESNCKSSPLTACRRKTPPFLGEGYRRAESLSAGLFEITKQLRIGTTEGRKGNKA